MAGGKYSIAKDSNIVFGTFPHAGEYVYTVTEKADTYKEAENQLEEAIKRVANEGLIGIAGEYGEIHKFEGVSCGIMPVKDGFLTKISRRWAKSFN